MFDLENMAKVSNHWKSSVVNFTRRNTLLVFKEGTSTIRVGSDNRPAVDSLFAGKTVRLPNLVESGADIEEANKAAEKLMKKQTYFLEELGVSPVNLAIGLARWDEPALPEDADKLRMANAPIFLLPLELEKRRIGGDSWRMRATQDLKLNGVLVHAAEAAGLKFDDDIFLENLPDPLTLEHLTSKLDDISHRLEGLKGLSVSADLYLAAFSYQDEAIYRDLSDVQTLFDSDVVRALAGDAEAIVKLQDIKEVLIDAPDREPPSTENLILDADASQIEAINSAMAGNTLVVEGPPGTGKSQTISNLLAECLSQNKKVLFVAQKRAAIDAVLKRLADKGLDSLVLDVHETSRGPQVAAQLASSFDNMRQTPPVDLTSVHEGLVAARDKLVGLKDAFVGEPRGLELNLSELRSLYYSVPEHLIPEWAIDVHLLSELTQQDHHAIKAAITEIAVAGGFSPDFGQSAESWNVNVVRTRDDLIGLIELAKAFDSTALQKLEILAGSDDSSHTSFSQLLLEARRNALSGWLHENAKKLTQKKRTRELVAAMGQTRGLKSDTSVTFPKKLLAALVGPLILPREHSTAVRALECYSELLRIDPEGKHLLSTNSLAVPDWDESLSLTQSAQVLVKSVQGLDLDSMSGIDFVAHLKKLSRDAKQFQIATYWENYDFLKTKGLEIVASQLQDYSARQPIEDEEFQKVFDAAASRALIEHALTHDPRLQGLDSSTLHRASERFRQYDREHLEKNALKIKRIAARNFKDAVDLHQHESLYLEDAASRRRGHKPLRTLIAHAPNLMLAANPIWAMSPIQVASYLPRLKIFDLVIFDEASQIKPEMAIPAIMRGTAVVVAGDTNQLPPTNFFAGGGLETIDEETNENELDSTTKDSESILESMERVIGSKKRRLLWHYRSRDERLIALSNIEIYGNSLTTFPASDSLDAVEHIRVSGGKNAKVASSSQNDEAQKVLELIKRHSLQHPEESLGVITFGTAHLKKLEMALAQLRAKDAELDSWLESQDSEPFFLKNLERVQGDERDAIIISTGYGKDANGKMNLRWGPLNSENGRRRLNVAISRAKRRMTLVTNFSLSELIEQNIRSGTGVELFRKFLDYMGNKGADYQHSSSLTPLNSFELDVKRRLEAEGLSLVPQYGVGNYRIDFAVRDPHNPDAFVLAVEADGASYHSTPIARERDRLRQTLLESRGWRFHRIWSTEWFRAPDYEVQKVLESLKAALSPDAGKASAVIEPKQAQVDSKAEPRRTLERPPSGKGGNIDDYPLDYLDSVIAFIQSDGLLRGNQEVMKEAREILGFSRKGVRIDSALESAIIRVNKKG